MQPTNHPVFHKGLRFQLLSDARQYVVNNADQRFKGAQKGTARIGVECPACGQLAAVYPRKFNSTMARGLIFIVNRFLATNDWVHVSNDAPRDIIRTNQWGTTQHWELIRQKPNDNDPTKRCSGLWKPTTRGINFVRQLLRIDQVVHLYDGFVQGFTQPGLSIIDALGNAFNYQQMMQTLR